jgi:DNA-directed RNA polymerase subunit P
MGMSGIESSQSGSSSSSIGDAKGNAPAPSEQPVKVFPGAVYECVRCGTRTTQEELASLPEVKCICGYRVFRKVRPSVVKQIKAV